MKHTFVLGCISAAVGSLLGLTACGPSQTTEVSDNSTATPTPATVTEVPVAVTATPVPTMSPTATPVTDISPTPTPAQ